MFSNLPVGKISDHTLTVVFGENCGPYERVFEQTGFCPHVLFTNGGLILSFSMREQRDLVEKILGIDDQDNLYRDEENFKYVKKIGPLDDPPYIKGWIEAVRLWSNRLNIPCAAVHVQDNIEVTFLKEAHLRAFEGTAKRHGFNDSAIRERDRILREDIQPPLKGGVRISDIEEAQMIIPL